MAAELTKYAIWLLSPLGAWLVLSLLALLGFFGRRRLRTALLVLAQAQLLFFSMPWVADHLFGSLEEEARQLEASRPLPGGGAGKVDAIVVLGGGLEGRFQGYRTLPDLNDSADRLWLGAQLYKQDISRRMVLSGGLFEADPRLEAEARGMKKFMMDMGVPEEVLLIEDRSRTTLENALRTREMLGIQAPRIALVTSAFHMGRSVMWFERAGFTVYPVRADVRVIPNTRKF
ncbi:MAG TPA: YdcF family protein, partial [Limnobacter sp.]|nr:YdcF family protein [Limnobacter sp.]